MSFPHVCPVAGCPRMHPASMLMCKPHWKSLPQPLRDTLWRTYTQDGVMSEAYQQARSECIAQAEGRNGR